MTSNPADTSVFILAAGRGERMRPLTDVTPKPLLQVNGKSLISYHLEKLAASGFKNIVINIAHLGEQIIEQIDDGAKLGLNIQYSDERQTGALETAGGIKQGLKLIESTQFICLNADIWTDFDFTKLLNKKTPCIVLVKNPEHNPDGDFDFNESLQLAYQATSTSGTDNRKSYTFSGIGFYQTTDFAAIPAGPQKLAPYLYSWGEQHNLSAIIHTGNWHDIGTVERLTALDQTLSES